MEIFPEDFVKLKIKIFVMKRFLILFVGALVIMLITTHCYYENEEHLFPSVNNSCDTTNVTYAGSVQPILSQNCYSCHSNSNAASFGGGYFLQNYADIKAHADDGKLLGSIEHKPGYFAMPLSGSLSTCNISTIAQWVNKGSPNN
jgi:hypothetical protein